MKSAQKLKKPLTTWELKLFDFELKSSKFLRTGVNLRNKNNSKIFCNVRLERKTKIVKDSKKHIALWKQKATEILYIVQYCW